MSKPLAANEFLLNTVRWVESASSPTAGQAGAVGSYWLQGNTYPTTPVTSYLKTANVATGWVRENLVNLGVYNVKNAPYNAVGNGSTDDTAAINAAVTAAAAAGGGVIYFPPGTYKVTKPVSGLGSIILDNKHDLVFLGDGYNSTISMIGSAGGGDWYMFKVTNGSSRIGWYNLHFAGDGITSPDPAQQNHCIQLQGVTADAAGGAHDIDIVGCYFGQFPGDAIRNLGNPSSEVHDIRILYNTFDMQVTTGSRSNVEAQRCSRRISFMFNWCTGSHDQLIDFEPTGGSGSGTDGPEEWVIMGNHFDGTTAGSTGLMVTIEGANETDLARRCLFFYNTMQNGDGIFGVDAIDTTIKGNIIVVNSAGSNPPVSFLRVVTQVQVIGNVLISLNAAGSKTCVNIVSNAGFTPFRCTAADNVVRTKAPAGVGPAVFSFSGGRGHACNGNIAVVDSVTADKSIGITITPDANLTGDSYQANGNLLLGTTQRMRTGVSLGSSGFASSNMQADYNVVDNAPSAALLSASTTWLCANNNMVIGGVNLTIEIGNSAGVSMEGIAGPGGQQIQNGATPAANVTAPVGSMCANTAGAAGSVLYIKESGSGVSGGSSGWVTDGASEFSFACQDTTIATAARFLATGMALVNASTVEIKFACPRAGTIRNLRVNQVAGTGAGTIAYTLRVNAGNTTLASTINFTATVGGPAGTKAVAAGDLISIQFTKSQAPATNPTFVVVTFELTS